MKEKVARYEPSFVGKLVNMCAALHNLGIDLNVNGHADLLEEDNVNNPDLNILQPGYLLNDGQRIRNSIVNRYFQN